jgi:hypothetical protein
MIIYFETNLAGLLPHVVGGVLDFLALDLTFLQKVRVGNNWH